MTPQDLDRELSAGKFRPVYLVAGEERFLADLAVRALRKACVDPSVADFNEDLVIAGEADIDRVLSACRTVPMMSPRRFVLVRQVERWEPRAQADDATASGKVGPLDRLAEYADKPVDSTCLVLSAAKLDQRRKIVTLAKKGGFLVTCDALDNASLARWIERAVAARKNRIHPETARLLGQMVGPELGHVADAVERLCLYVGEAREITEDAISELIVRVRETSVFELISSVGARDLGKALAALSEVFDPRDGGLGLVGLLAWSVRQLLKFRAAIDRGAPPDEAARGAGVPPFRARDTAAQVRKLSQHELERWLGLLAEADLALKSSRRPARSIMDTLVIDMAGG